MHYTLCDQFVDLTQNAIEADASLVQIDFYQTEKALELSITDNGKGMDEEQLKKARDPFYTDGEKHPGRKIGLGIPFLIQTASATNGKWEIKSEKGLGTRVFCAFDLTNIDLPPVGDVPGFFRQVVSMDGDYELLITRRLISQEKNLDYKISRKELISALGNLTEASSLILLKEYLEGLELPE